VGNHDHRCVNHDPGEVENLQQYALDGQNGDGHYVSSVLHHWFHGGCHGDHLAVGNIGVEEVDVVQMDVVQMNVVQMDVVQMDVVQMDVVQMDVVQLDVVQLDVVQMNVVQTGVVQQGAESHMVKLGSW
jgi:hypothetical protein